MTLLLIVNYETRNVYGRDIQMVPMRSIIIFYGSTTVPSRLRVHGEPEEIFPLLFLVAVVFNLN